MQTIKVEVAVEATKSPKWTRLAPVDRGAIGPVVIKATEIPAGAKRLFVTISDR